MSAHAFWKWSPPSSASTLYEKIMVEKVFNYSNITVS